MAKPTRKTHIHKKIYSYLNYRLFLSDLVRELKSVQKSFTMRSFAKTAGFGSPSYLKMIIDGQRQLTTKSMDKFCHAFYITGREKDYFEILVKYNQSKDPDEKDLLLDELKEIRPRTTFSDIEKNKQEYLTKDYYSVIREMVLLQDFQEDPKWIADRLSPKISVQEARTALEVLQKLNLIKKNEDGKFVQIDSVVGTSQNTKVLESFHFHEMLLNKARTGLTIVPSQKRNFQALVVPLNSDIIALINEKMERLILEVLDEVNLENIEYDDVYQMSLQFFPVTQMSD